HAPRPPPKPPAAPPPAPPTSSSRTPADADPGSESQRLWKAPLSPLAPPETTLGRSPSTRRSLSVYCVNSARATDETSTRAECADRWVSEWDTAKLAPAAIETLRNTPRGPGESERHPWRCRMFTYKLRHADGTPADPPAITLAVPNMRVGDTIPPRRGEALRAV